jgi:hypothetical protein
MDRDTGRSKGFGFVEMGRRGRHFDPVDVRAFVALGWPCVGPDPDPGRWAQEFIDRGHVNSGA